MTSTDHPCGLWRICAIGGFRLERQGEARALRSRKAQALLWILSLSAPARLPRERAADMLWSGSELGQARQSLRQTLHDLRRALGPEMDRVVQVGRTELALASPAPAFDLDALIADLSESAAPPELDWSALPGALLSGLEDVDPEFGDWIAARRRALTDQIATVLERRMESAPEAGRIAFAQALAALDPTHEPACRRLMEHDAAKGDARAALRRYGALWELLDEELAAEPSPETQALAIRLKSLDSLDGGAPLSAAERPNLTIIAPEYRMEGVPEEHGYLVRGFRRDLIASLTPYREWVVIEPDDDAPALREDGVYSLEGVAFPRKPGVRINATLKELASRRFIWGEQDIALEMESWFETCRATTRRLAAALDVRVAGDRLARRRAIPDAALPLYDRLLKARDLMTLWEPEAERRAEAIFRDIVARDPQMHRARLGLAQILTSRHIVFPGAPLESASIAEALRAARMAAEADPLDAEAQLALGWALAMSGLHGEAVAAMRAACENNPTHPRTLASAADALAQSGETAQALELEETVRFLERAPSRLSCAYFTSARFLSGDYAGAADLAARAQWNIPIGGGWGAAALALDGRVDQARRVFADWADWVRARWVGGRMATDAQIAAWCAAAPPLADPGQRALLGKGLALACAQRQDEKV